MLISGWVKTSLVDYPEKLASVVFTQGCNMQCFYCHNKDLIHSAEISKFDENEILSWVLKRKTFIEAVVVTGGEPTMQKDLPVFLQRIKNMGLSTKIDTNGTHPEVLELIIEKGLADYIAMDIKAPFEKYGEFCREGFDKSCFKESIRVIKNSGLNHEFRTTMAPGILAKDVEDIQKIIGSDAAYYLQKCRGVEHSEIVRDEVMGFSTVRYRGF